MTLGHFYRRPSTRSIRPLTVWILLFAVPYLGPNQVLGQIDFPPLKDLSLVQESRPVTFSASYQRQPDSNTGKLLIEATIAPGWYLYSLDQKKPPIALKFSVLDPSFAKFSGSPKALTSPKKGTSEDWPGIEIEKHLEKGAWEVPLELLGKEDRTWKLKIVGQACTIEPGKCLPVSQELDVSLQTISERRQTAITVPESLPKYRHPHAHVTWVGWMVPSKPSPEGKAVLFLNGKPDIGGEWYHLYPWVPTEQVRTGQATVIGLKAVEGLKYGTPKADQETVQLDGSTFHEGEVTWSIPLEFHAGAKEITELQGAIGFQTCTNNKCDRPVGASFKISFTEAEPHAAVHFLDGSFRDAVLVAKESASALDPKLGLGGDLVPAEKPKVNPIDKSLGGGSKHQLPGIVALSFLGGIILNLMPCVFPVIGLKVMALINLADGDRRKVFVLNCWYVLGLLTVFWALAGFAISLKVAGSSYAWGQQFSNTGFQIALVSFVFMMALSFLGVWEIPIPGFAMSRSATGLQQQEGASGAFFKGVFTTLLATPCSGPFLGVVFGYLAVSPTWQTPLVFTSMGLGMGFPYLVLGAFPRLARFLPKPGEWMESFKHLMGFVLLFVTAWLFWTVSAKFVKPTFLLLMGIWLGCWLAGRVPVYAPTWKRIQGWALGIAVAAATGFFGFVLLDIRIVKFIPYSEEQLVQLQREGKTVMVDFTASWCFNCHTNFVVAINTYEVAEKLKQLDAVAMLADLSEQEALERVTPKMEELGANSIPLLAIFPGARPHQPIILRDLISKPQLLSALEEAGHSRKVVARRD